MAHVLIPGGMRVVLQARDVTEGELINVFHVKALESSISYADCLSVANTFKDFWDNYYRHLCSDQIHGTQVVVTGTDTVPAAQASVGLTTTGDRVGTGLTTSITLAIKGVTHIAGRRYRGRNYLFPAVQPDLQPLNPDVFNPGYVNAAVGVFNNLIANLSITNYALGVGSYTDGAIRPYTSYVAVDDLVDAQRRRLQLRGR